MITQLCVSPFCGLPGQHRDDCDGEGAMGGECRGCLPARAADGAYLCGWCIRRLPHDAFGAVARYEALALQLVGGGPAGAEGSGSGSGDIELNAAAVEAREAIRSTLTGIVRLVAEERGIALPGRPWRWEVERLPFGFVGPPRRHRREVAVPELVPLAEFIRKHADWLAAHPAADEHARDLRDIATDPRTQRLAYPSASDRLFIGECPGCDSRLYQLPDEPLVSCRDCKIVETVEWWQRWIVGEAGGVVDINAAASHLSMRWGVAVGPADIRNWTTRGKVSALGRWEPETLPASFIGPPNAKRVALRDERRRTLYHLDELTAYARLLYGPPIDELARRRRSA